MVKPYVMEGYDTDQKADHNNQSREKEEREVKHLRGKWSSPDETKNVSLSEPFSVWKERNQVLGNPTSQTEYQPMRKIWLWEQCLCKRAELKIRCETQKRKEVAGGNPSQT